MSSEDRRVLAVVGFAALCCLPLRAAGPSAPPLGNAASFAVLGASSVTSSGATVVTGNLGVSPGNTITGFPFPPGIVKLGDIFKNDALAKAAHNDAGVAYTQLSTGTCKDLTSPLSSLSEPLPPDTYCVTSPALLPALLKGTLTLDANNIPGAVWIFRITGALATDTNSSVLAINGAQPGNVFWQVSGSAILGKDSAFVGNLIAHDNIALNSGANAFGRLLALTGTVMLDSNNVTLCSTCNAISLDPPTLPGGTVNAPYSQTITASGGTGSYSFKRISGSLPTGLTLASDGVLSGTPVQFGSFPITVAATDSQGCSGERKYTITIPIACPDLTLSPTTLPGANACVEIQQPITGSGGSGTYKYTSDDLPIELKLIPVNGTPSTILTGTFATPGDHTFTVTAEDTVTHCVVSRTYSLKVLCFVTISPEALPPATACASYCTTLTTSCGTGYTFSVAPGTLPAGFSLSTDGKLCVAPTTPGRYTFTVTATNKLGCTGSQTYTVPVGGGPIVISPPTLPDGIVGTKYPDQTITANCGTPGYRCRVTAGALPPGLTFANCKISGTPTTEGCFTFSVTVTDANGNTNSIRYTICICAITISPPVLPNGSICAAYPQQQLTASCGTPPYTFSVPPGTLPPGLSLSSTGLLSGTPSVIGTTIFTVTATDSAQNTGTITYTLPVTGGLTLSPAILSMAAFGAPYSETLTASGGLPPYTFAVTTGALPTGLFLNMTTGEISGTPLVLGTFNFCITVTDSNAPACKAIQCYTITVAVPAGGPTLSGWGMLVLAMLLVGAGLFVLRRG
jgi:hypothetical protein